MFDEKECGCYNSNKEQQLFLSRGSHKNLSRYYVTHNQSPKPSSKESLKNGWLKKSLKKVKDSPIIHSQHSNSAKVN
jgi:hypothetical protein